jgi:hypothetical protein
MQVRTALHVHSVTYKQACNNDVMTSSTSFTSCIPEGTYVEEVDIINHVVADLRIRIHHQMFVWLQYKRRYKTWHCVFYVKYFVPLHRYLFYNPTVRYECVFFTTLVEGSCSQPFIRMVQHIVDTGSPWWRYDRNDSVGSVCSVDLDFGIDLA